MFFFADEDEQKPSIVRLGILLLLFDVYLTWARIEKEIPTDPSHTNAFGILTRQPIVVQYIFFCMSLPPSRHGLVGMRLELTII